jgi:syntaxin-binding protein 1
MSKTFDFIVEKSEILNRNVSSVEILDQRRQTQTYLEAVYIMKPTAYNVDCLAADYTRVPARYAGAHIFFLPGLTEDLARKVKNSPAGRYVRKLEVKYLDFLPLEAQLFSLDAAYANEVFHNRHCHDLVHPEIQKISSSLVSLCVALGEYPSIRFQKPPKSSYEANMLPYMVASTFQKEIDMYARNDANFPNTNDNRPRSMFLVVDRSIDAFAPLLHEFTYQAMAYDLLPIKDGNKYVYETEKAGGGSEQTEGVLSEKDAEWVSLRHMHMQDAIDTLTQKLDKFKKENPHLVDKGTDASVTDLQDMIASLPMFAEMKERFALHLQMANECMNLFQKKNLNDIANIEQTCATGVGPDGRRNKALTDDMIELLADKDNILGNRDKVRILILYALYRGGLVEADYQKLKTHCKLEDIDLLVVKNLGLLGSPTFKETPKSKLSKDSVVPRYHGTASGDVYETSRFVPGLKNVIEGLIRNQLDPTQFPFTKDEPAPDADDMTEHSSLRNPRQRAAWAKSNAYQAIKQRIFVFVIGGVTPSESRSAYEISKTFSKEVIIGGSCLLNPNGFLRNLSRLTMPRQQLQLPMDQPPKRAPDHLFESDRDTRKQQQPQQPPQQQKPQNPSSAIPGPASVSLNDNTNKTVKSKKSKFGKLFK